MVIAATTTAGGVKKPLAFNIFVYLSYSSAHLLNLLDTIWRLAKLL